MADLQEAVLSVQRLLMPLKASEFSEKVGKVSVYIQSAAKSQDERSLNNSIRFAILNLEAVMVQALEAVVWRPRLASRADEQKKASSLQKTFDRLEDPAKAMLEHFSGSSDPLNKYLVAGPWGHEYLIKRNIDLEDYDLKLCELLGCQQTDAGRIVQSYAEIRRGIEQVRLKGLQMLNALSVNR